MYNPHAEIIERLLKVENLLLDLSKANSTLNEFKHSIKPPATRHEAGAFLGLSLPTVDSLIKSGELHSFNIGRQVRIKWADLEDFVNKKGAKQYA